VSTMKQGYSAAKARLVIVIAAVLIGSAAAAQAQEPPGTTQGTAASGRAHWSAVFTGEYLDGAPIYRLPPAAAITVTATRSVELSRMVQEAQLARAAPSRAQYWLRTTQSLASTARPARRLGRLAVQTAVSPIDDRSPIPKKTLPTATSGRQPGAAHLKPPRGMGLLTRLEKS